MTKAGERVTTDEAGAAGTVRSVTTFTREVKALLETGLGRGWVRGEVSNLRLQASGHAYFALKDAGAQLACVLFRGDGARQTARLRDGAQVVVFGDVSVYEARGQYQLIVRAIVDDGEGRLRREFEALKARLAAEGLFERDRKRVLPVLPARVGIVTSPTGAAVQDFIRILTRLGWRGRLVVFPVRVQGAEAAGEIAAAIKTAGEGGWCDVLVVGRGGGSLEDLWAFNEEPVVRAVVAAPVPVISAVGHEIDFTLCDLAADVRAETPSGAAELLASRYGEARERLEVAAQGLLAGLDETVAVSRDRVGHLRTRLRLLAPTARIEQGWLRRDDLANRLGSAMSAGLREQRSRLQAVTPGLTLRVATRRVEQESQRLLALWKRLQSASPASVLRRGFVIMRDDQGRPLARREGIAAGRKLAAEFHDGTLDVEAR
jgi:exodeoxyribonuclease VII large subunit